MRRVEVMDPSLVREQIEAVVLDVPPGAAKTGALGSAAVVEVVAEAAERFEFPLVVDPVMISKHGAALMDEAARVEGFASSPAAGDAGDPERPRGLVVVGTTSSIGTARATRPRRSRPALGRCSSRGHFRGRRRCGSPGSRGSSSS
ncbi:MAG: bifunctional hydroxymethylpyrimidine kinase/phosphomethylpyrimidine kinase [Sandaracinaceae bacterium]